MLIELLYLEGCPHYGPFLVHLRELLEQAGVPERVQLRPLDETSVEDERFLGSPTLRINGKDVDPAAAARHQFGILCRVYATPEGFNGSPPDEWVLSAVRAAQLPGRPAPGPDSEHEHGVVEAADIARNEPAGAG
jgi:hypothetical protein